MASWMDAYRALGGCDIGCPQCHNTWGHSMTTPDKTKDHLNTDFLSFREAIELDVRCCQCGWEGKIKEYKELIDGGWAKITRWWTGESPVSPKVAVDTDLSLRKQMDNNLRSIFT
jgi:pyruvate-formate lyase-activating enzyme